MSYEGYTEYRCACGEITSADVYDSRPSACRCGKPFCEKREVDQTNDPTEYGEWISMVNDWIEWNGGECPVPGETEVMMRFRNGATSVTRAKHCRWDHPGAAGDIIAYRVVSRPPASAWTPWGDIYINSGRDQPMPANDNSFCDRILGEPAKDVKANIADEAKRIVSGARRAAYGKPEQNFERIARFWQAYFENTGRTEAAVTAADVSPLMRLMKEARLCETPDHRDSYVDIVGYTLTGAEINGVAA